MPRISAAQRRDDFIRAAVEVIATHGIDGATTRRIADEAKANLAMLHYCYDSKEALFADVFVYVAGKYAEVIERSDPHTTVEEAARAVLRGVMRFYLDSPNFAVTAIELISWARRQHEDRGIAVYERATQALRDVLQEAAGEAPLPEDTVEEIAYILATLADGFAVSWIAYGNRELAEQQLDVVMSVLDAWLAARLGAGAATAPARRRRTARV
jgi:AcrR family transcriptional regulator